MLDYYYIDLYFDPDRDSFGKVAEACIKALRAGGCEFRKVVMASADTRKSVDMEEHVQLSLEDLPAVAEAYAEEMESSGTQFISFPPLGRVMFHCPFSFDDSLMDDIHEDEDEAHSEAEDMGLVMMYTTSQEAGRKIKVSLSFWEEYVLSHGKPETHLANMRRVLRMVRAIYEHATPYFGAMNKEIHLDTDLSLTYLIQSRLPEGNEFAIVGKRFMDMIKTSEVEAAGYKWASMPDGGIIIQFEDKWEGQSAL